MRARASADAAFGRSDYRAANRWLDEGLGVLGNAYVSDDIIDDTGMHLTLARIQAGRGRLKEGAVDKRTVLSERLRLCLGR